MAVATALDPAFILAEAARLREALVRDQTYLSTPIGKLVGRYLDQLRFDNYSPKTIYERELELARLAVHFADREPDEVDLPDLRAFLAEFWSDAAPVTRRRVVSTVRVFFTWAHENDRIPANPARKLKGPRAKDEDSPRRAHSRATIRKLVNSQESRRDRILILLVYWLALRRFELRRIQVRDIDFASRVVTVHGKGGTVLEQNLPRAFANELEVYLREIGAKPDDYLLYPQRKGRRGSYPLYAETIIWEDRKRPLSLGGVDKWWQRCRARAGLPDLELHELRHTAGTHFHQESRDLVATQHFLRHRDPSTTAKTYIHLDRVRAVSDVQRRMVDPLAEGDA